MIAQKQDQRTPAVVFRAANRPTIEEVAVPSLRDDDVLVRTRFSGISIGTEQSIFSGKRTHNGTFPLVSGYMASGIVEAVGRDVTHVAVGDAVVTEGARLEGKVNSVWGAHMAVRVAPGWGVFKLPEKMAERDVAMREAAMWILPRVGLHGVNVASLAPGSTVVVQGQGLIGQFFGQFAKGRGCRVITIEPNARRAELSRRYVTDDVLDPMTDDLAGRIADLTDGVGADVVVEATGSKQLIGQASALLRERAHFVFLGWYPDHISLDYHHFHNNIVAHFPMGAGDDDTARHTLSAIGEGRITVGDNISDIVPWREACEGFGRIIAGDRSVMGMVIDWRDA